LRRSAAATLNYFAGLEAYKSQLATFIKLKNLTDKQRTDLEKYLID